MKRKRKQQPFENPIDDPRVFALLNDWSLLSRAERGKRITPLLQDYTPRKLNGPLSCSEKEVRNCVDLWRWSLVKSKLRISDKNVLKLAAEYRATQRKWKQMTRGAAGKRLHRKLVRTLVKWFKENMKDPWVWEGFFFEQDRCREAKQEIMVGAPWYLCDIDGDWEAIIQATRPSENYLQQAWEEYKKPRLGENWAEVMAELPPPDDYRKTHWSFSSRFRFYRQWLGAWLPRCVQDGKFAKSALSDARCLLRRETMRRQALAPKKDKLIVDWRMGPLTLEPQRRRKRR